MSQKKILMIVCDGLSDRPVKQFNMKTPLQVVRKPAMDALTRHGISGTMDVIGPGIVPGSDTAHLALFGYDPFKVYTGRGPIEAAGAGLELERGDVAFRCNFATVNKSFVVTDRRAGRIKSGTLELARSVTGMKIDGITASRCYRYALQLDIVQFFPSIDHAVLRSALSRVIGDE